MAPRPALEEQKQILEARYTSSTGETSFTHPITTFLPDQKSPTFTSDKTAYLSELRSSTKRLQGEINTFLTEKMEEDKAAAAKNGVHGKEEGKVSEKVAEEAAEENYGDEVMDDED